MKEEKLLPEQKARETIVLGLRLIKGISLKNIERRFNLIIGDEIISDLKTLKRMKLLVNKGDCWKLTAKGIFFYDNVACTLIGD